MPDPAPAPTSPAPFGARLAAAFARTGQLCVGIDPHLPLLEEWGLPASGAGVREFGLRVVEAAAGRASAVKPQVAFFERFGAAGYAALEEVLAAGRAAGLLVIADGKRGDIGSTMAGYAGAWLEPGAPLEADALTIYAAQGFGADEGAVAQALRAGKGLFVVTATSNPEAREVQSAMRAEGPHAGATLAGALTREVAARNAAAVGAGETPADTLGSIGIVIGGTLRLAEVGIDPADLSGVPILAPGFGFQGAVFADLPEIYGAALPNALVSVSRSVLAAGPEGMAAAVASDAAALARVLASGRDS
ncbi:MAG: orotidine-5'-phosphate decarboxylase [Actinomycetales bacterium]|nr:orotidine-5'-phosphate decarboxylase [Actinomycetales bacterium]